MKKIIVNLMGALLLMSNIIAHATTINCIGTDTTGRRVYFYADTRLPGQVNINGDILRIVGRTRDNQGIVTENFVTTTGVLVYDSIMPHGNSALDLYQFNAVTDRLLARAFLQCQISNYKSLKSMNLF